MTQRELRNIIVKQLHTYLAGPKVCCRIKRHRRPTTP